MQPATSMRARFRRLGLGLLTAATVTTLAVVSPMAAYADEDSAEANAQVAKECIYNGEFFPVNTVLTFTDNRDYECQSDGKWKRLN